MFKHFSTKSQDLQRFASACGTKFLLRAVRSEALNKNFGSISAQSAVKQLLTARLSRRVVLWIFGSFSLIVGMILVPSLQRREQEMLTQMRQVTSGKVLWIATTFPNTTSQQLLEKVQQLKKDPMLSTILGGAVYTEDGKLIGTFGETPELPFTEAIAEGMMHFEAGDRLMSHNRRYDATWIVSRPGPDDIVVIRHDASSVNAEVYSYIFWMTGLSLVISAVITATTMVVLGATVITPILILRQDLLTAGESIRHDQPTPQFQSNFTNRQDELGEVIRAFRQMFSQISQAVEERKQAEAELLDNNRQMSQYIQHVNLVTAAAAAVEAGEFQIGSLQAVSDRPDELGRLARMFQNMVEQVQEREAELKQQVEDLKIEIDHVKRVRQVSEVTQSDWFQALQLEVDSLRQIEAMQDEVF